MTHKIKLLLASAALALTTSASASLIGDTVTCSDAVSGACNPASAVVVDPGIEFLAYSGLLNVNVLASAIELSPFIGFAIDLGGASTLTIGDLDWLGPPQDIVGFVITSSSGVGNLVAGDLSFGSDSVSINLQGTQFNVGSTALLTIQTRDAAVVPEPATLALLSLGFAGLGFSRRRKLK